METIRFFSKHPTEGIRITSSALADRIISANDYVKINDHYSAVRYIASEIMEELCKQPELAATDKGKQVDQCIDLLLFASEELYFCSKTGLACLKKAKVILEKLLQELTGEHPEELFDEAIKLADEIIRTVNEFIDCEDEISLQIEEKQAKTA